MDGTNSQKSHDRVWISETVQIVVTVCQMLVSWPIKADVLGEGSARKDFLEQECEQTHVCALCTLLVVRFRAQNNDVY